MSLEVLNKNNNIITVKNEIDLLSPGVINLRTGKESKIITWGRVEGSDVVHLYLDDNNDVEVGDYITNET